ncbi:hypothetical protein CYMTET_13881 [Cymbomonas tetramitiformis]|uniref:Uncharacterized protein n=1 Tax=Cymbomonas tetramitiformis TaxID=36881 RepID=A0AAE0GHI1_9CHLO|nr:hypothetical protein CYMTET_13881 [Cymbomonas tetramitiformis]
MQRERERVKPLVGEALGVSEDVMHTTRVVGLLITVALMLTTLRSNVQAFLGSGLVQWYETVHGSHTTISDAEQEKRLTLLRMRLEVNSTLLVKVAIQAFVPAVIMLGLATLLSLKDLKYEDDEKSLIPTVFVVSFSSFLSFWLCSTWMLISGITLCCFRLGVLA